MKHELEAAIGTACKELFDGHLVDVELVRPDEEFGDYATNVAMRLAGKIGASPREIAEILSIRLRDVLGERMSGISVAGPGFLNITLSDSALLSSVRVRPTQHMAGKTVVVEYSDPNPFKPLHAGHLYTTLIGDMIARLIEYAGAKTIRINYGGDVGLHVGKSMWAIIKHLGGELPDKLADVPDTYRAGWLGERYVEGNNAYEEDPGARAQIVALNKRVYQLHAIDDHDSPFAQIYWAGRQWSYDYFKSFYETLQVRPFDRYIPESEVAPLGLRIVREQLARGIYEKNDGAIVFQGEKYGLHTRVFINSEGLPTYEAKDVGLSLTKWQDYHFDRSVIITANEQAQYMAVVIASLGQFAPEPAERTDHLTHGAVKLQGGMKMSSRKGNIVTGSDILIAAREAGIKAGMLPTVETVLAAVKYAFGKNRIGGDIIYDPKESIALDGNSGPYLQYAHARARSILRKADFQGDSLEIDALEAGERSLARKISEYPEVIEKAVIELMPHYICTYLYELAQVFNRFYEHNRVIGSERQNVRLQLVAFYADKLKAGLSLLGIIAPDTM